MGKAVACQLAAKGANVVIVARTPSKLESALGTIKVGGILTFVLMLAMLIFWFRVLLRTPPASDSTTSAPT